MSIQIAAALPRYRCHKEVWALKIEHVKTAPDEPGFQLVPENKAYAPIPVSTEWVHTHKAQDGGYWVQYKDGYTSFSPAQAFEEGYTLITSDTFMRTPIVGVP